MTGTRGLVTLEIRAVPRSPPRNSPALLHTAGWSDCVMLFFLLGITSVIRRHCVRRLWRSSTSGGRNKSHPLDPYGHVAAFGWYRIGNGGYEVAGSYGLRPRHIDMDSYRVPIFRLRGSGVADREEQRLFLALRDRHIFLHVLGDDPGGCISIRNVLDPCHYTGRFGGPVAWRKDNLPLQQDRAIAGHRSATGWRSREVLLSRLAHADLAAPPGVSFTIPALASLSRVPGGQGPPATR